MTTKADLPPVPHALADVALIDAPTCAASAGVSISRWHQQVRDRIAPQPVIRGARFTRWQLAQVRSYLIAQAGVAAAETCAVGSLTARATQMVSKKDGEAAAKAKPKAKASPAAAALDRAERGV
jgi:predicted DNA-binding transcriptional regulator AlpA